MIAIHGQTTTWFDCDETLVLWCASTEDVEKNGIVFTCPSSLTMNSERELVTGPSWSERLVPHKKHIEQLKAHKSRNSIIVVWSAAGLSGLRQW